MGYQDKAKIKRSDVACRPVPKLNYFKVYARLLEGEHIEFDFNKVRKENIERIRRKADLSSFKPHDKPMDKYSRDLIYRSDLFKPIDKNFLYKENEDKINEKYQRMHMSLTNPTPVNTFKFKPKESRSMLNGFKKQNSIERQDK
jgi:hypothetical protein